MFSLNQKLPVFLHKKLSALFQKYSIPRWMVFSIDNFAIFFVFFLSYLLRFNFVLQDFNINQAIHHSLITVLVYAIISLIFRSYTGLIRHTAVMDIFIVAVTTTLSFVFLLSLSLIGRKIGFYTDFIVPVSILFIHYFSITIMLIFERIFIKILYLLVTISTIKKRKVLIYGVGKMGIAVKRAIQSDSNGSYRIIGFLDNDKKLQGKKLNGYSVYNPDILSVKR
jgi:FlaA1/EpsC-like NDP-sugar epimerase